MLWRRPSTLCEQIAPGMDRLSTHPEMEDGAIAGNEADRRPFALCRDHLTHHPTVPVQGQAPFVTPVITSKLMPREGSWFLSMAGFAIAIFT